MFNLFCPKNVFSFVQMNCDRSSSQFLLRGGWKSRKLGENLTFRRICDQKPNVTCQLPHVTCQLDRLRLCSCHSVMEAANRQHVKFQPNEEYFEALLAMGISESHAQEALFCTGNESVEAAVSYVFTNLLQEDNEDESFLPEGGVAENCVQDNAKRYKMTFVVNMSLKMGVGKIAAQVAHACLGLYREMRISGDKEDGLNEWDYFGEKKIVLKGENTEQLEELFNKAKGLNVPCYLVSDAGHTQIPPGSVTVLSVFGDEDEVNAITGSLSLL